MYASSQTDISLLRYLVVYVTGLDTHEGWLLLIDSAIGGLRDGSTPALLSSASAEMFRPKLHATYASANMGAFPQSVDAHAGVVPVKHWKPAQRMHPTRCEQPVMLDVRYVCQCYQRRLPTVCGCKSQRRSRQVLEACALNATLKM